MPVSGGFSAAVVDDLPPRVLVEFTSTISYALDIATGEVTRVELTAMPDQGRVFDAETWHELHRDDESVAELLQSFDPRLQESPGSVRWLEKEPYAS